MKKYLFTISIVVLLFSCSDLNKTKYISSIDQMSKTIDSIHSESMGYKVDSLTSMSQNVYTVEKRIKRHYKEDVIDMTFARKMDAYNRVKKSYKHILKAHAKLKIGCEEELETLASLKSDIENGNGERDKYAEFVMFEQNKVQQLKVLLTDFTEQHNNAITTYNELHEEIAAYSIELMKKDSLTK